MNIHEEFAALVKKYYEKTDQWVERADFRQMQGITSDGKRAGTIVQVTLIVAKGVRANEQPDVS